ncbi:male sterility protein-domain-containing protein [Dunaliella salina]|uniref:Fatty acyl-CoA reductase n=1 Tax=Dunaliella salina TaxID=3046 RepID=A0ABQ7GCN5_DUNSA|nr:male sterility protein-domain-containing protein [Dunaliella salina]|eukprot:KAF5832367.1 male sterility protein-domain-containing protein [Dunaliella salina]
MDEVWGVKGSMLDQSCKNMAPVQDEGTEIMGLLHRYISHLRKDNLKDGTRKHLQATIIVVVNAAASTSFDECYECALKVNALSAQATAELAASCEHLDCLVHVSTAYTGANLNLEGMVPEQLHGYALNCGTGSGNGSGQSKVPHSADTFSVAEEVDLTLRARASGASDEDSKQLGITRARELRYLETYTLTKSMGEMLVSQVARKARIPTAIIRPNIVEGTWEESIPGWIEGNKSADPIITLYGRGQIPGFPFKSPESVLDSIPVDFVSRAMVAAIWSAASQDSDAGSTPRIYHVSSSSTQNPMTMGMFAKGVR